jgi:hypothetical protein
MPIDPAMNNSGLPNVAVLPDISALWLWDTHSLGWYIRPGAQAARTRYINLHQ